VNPGSASNLRPDKALPCSPSSPSRSSLRRHSRTSSSSWRNDLGWADSAVPEQVPQDAAPRPLAAAGCVHRRLLRTPRSAPPPGLPRHGQTPRPLAPDRLAPRPRRQAGPAARRPPSAPAYGRRSDPAGTLKARVHDRPRRQVATRRRWADEVRVRRGRGRGAGKSPPGVYYNHFLTDEAEKFIRGNARPAVLPPGIAHAPHIPLEAKPAVLAKYPNKPMPGVAIEPVYAATLESLDEGVGRLLQTLDELKLTSGRSSFSRPTTAGWRPRRAAPRRPRRTPRCARAKATCTKAASRALLVSAPGSVVRVAQ